MTDLPAPARPWSYTSPWTDEHVATLKEMWIAGKSSREIAQALDGLFSRNAVIAKAHRLGIAQAYPVSEHEKRRREMETRGRQPPRVPRPIIRLGMPRSAPTIVSDAPLPDLAGNVPAEQRRTLIDLTNESCRWPYGDPLKPGFFFCGANSADLANNRPYCAGHARMAYRCEAVA